MLSARTTVVPITRVCDEDAVVAHLYLIASAKEGDILSDIIRDFKKFTAIIAGISTEPETLPSF
ncbi:hypothetical protein [Reichenbachiella agariperforans]|uniref:hypothetical protein n=1 Tax=Reichenbachiella agariperforans TaxID=156994 RepID=UPI00093279AF|nr:hypothetical protein [Reichenbachiella agariperforans]